MDQRSLRLRFRSREQEAKMKDRSCSQCGIIDASVRITDWGEALCLDCRDINVFRR